MKIKPDHPSVGHVRAVTHGCAGWTLHKSSVSKGASLTM